MLNYRVKWQEYSLVQVFMNPPNDLCLISIINQNANYSSYSHFHHDQSCMCLHFLYLIHLLPRLLILVYV